MSELYNEILDPSKYIKKMAEQQSKIEIYPEEFDINKICNY